MLVKLVQILVIISNNNYISIDISSECARVIPLRDKEGVTVTNDFQKILKESHCKRNKVWEASLDS